MHTMDTRRRTCVCVYVERSGVGMYHMIGRGGGEQGHSPETMHIEVVQDTVDSKCSNEPLHSASQGRGRPMQWTMVRKGPNSQVILGEMKLGTVGPVFQCMAST